MMLYFIILWVVFLCVIIDESECDHRALVALYAREEAGTL